MGAKLWLETNLRVVISYENGTSNERIKLKLADYWLHCPEEIVLKEVHPYSDFRQERMEGYAQHNKEILKQTMLQHEEIFRGQVRELHRLYRVQKLLMAELRKKDFNSPNLNSVTPQTSPFMFQFGSEHIQLEGKIKIWDALSGSVTDTDTVSLRQPIPGMSDRQTLTSDLLGQRPRMRTTPQETKNCSNNFYRMQPHRATCRTLDLERPAAEYINEETTYPNEEDTVLKIAVKDDAKERPSNFLSYHKPESDVQLTLGTGWGQGTRDNGRKICPSLALGFSELMRDEMEESRGLIYSKGMEIFPAASTRPEVSYQKLFRNQRELPKQNLLEGPWGSVPDHQNYEDCRTEWQKFDVEHEKSEEERQSHNLKTAQRSTEENLKSPPWLLQALSLNRL